MPAAAAPLYLCYMSYDYLIVGQGICGTLLSWFLHKEGKSFLVLDEDRTVTSSKVAAGIINPVTGRRFVRSWMIEELLPFAHQTYTDLETAWGTSLIQARDMIRFFSSAEARDLFVTRITEDDTYLHTYPDQNHFNQYFHDRFGCGRVSPAYSVAVPQLLHHWQKQLVRLNAFRVHQFKPEAVQLQEDGILYEGITAQKIIFCDGIQGEHNPWFGNLPFSANKGEALIIESTELTNEHIFKKNFILAPLPEANLYWVGSNYENRFTDAGPTEAFRKGTEHHLKEWLKVPFTVVDHKAAIRPATVERRPFAGLHPEYAAIGILNGMGSKGTSLAPYFAHQFVQHLLYGHPITPEADVQRFRRILSR